MTASVRKAVVGAAVLIGVTVAAADLPTAPPDSVGMSSARLARLDAAVEGEIAAGRLPGMVVAVARRGRVMAQLMPNDSALMQRVETLIYQAIVD
jgi:CubicO group peptidase (beta-lactamase class C family)